MKRTRVIPIVAGGAAAIVAGVVAARRRAAHRTDPHELYALRFRMSHEVLRRNLDHFIELIDTRAGLDLEALGELVRLYGEFLVVHHESEDKLLFPELRRSSRLRTTDAAHLERWSAEHRDINAAGRALAAAGERLDAAGMRGLGDIRALAGELSDLLHPHLRAEEELINAERLREMVPARALAGIGRPAARLADHPARMAAFYAHSLAADEQRQVFGEAPWFFRKLILPRVDRALYRRNIALAPSVDI